MSGFSDIPNHRQAIQWRKSRGDNSPKDVVLAWFSALVACVSAVRASDTCKNPIQACKGESSPSRVKAAKSALSEKNLAALRELAGNLCSLVDLAVEQFINALREKGHAGINKESPEFRAVSER